jgi:DNA-binding MarR family transcriptional regulator
VLCVTAKGAKALEIGIPLWEKAQKEIADVLGPEKLALLKELTAVLQEL